MEIIKHASFTPTRTDDISEAKWGIFVGALSQSESFDTYFEKFEDGLDKFADYLLGKVGIETSRHQHQSFAENVLRDILVFALLKDATEPYYEDSDGNQYVVKKDDGKISLIKCPAKCSQLPVDSGETLYQFKIQSSLEAILTAFQNANSTQAGNALNALLQNNQHVLVRLSEHIVANKEQFPLALMRLAVRHLWSLDRAKYSLDKTLVLESCYPIRQYVSSGLQSFFHSEELPDAEKDKLNLAEDVCMTACLRSDMKGRDAMSNVQLEALLFLILKDFKSVDFQNESLKRCKEGVLLDILYLFFERHFTGSEIHFPEMYLPDTKYVKAMCSLIRNNPNLKSVSFNNSCFSSEDIEFISQAIADNVFIEKVSFTGFSILDEHALAMVFAFARRYVPIEINLEGNAITLKSALALMECSAIMSLNFRCNHLTEDDFPRLLEALKKNPALFSLKLTVLRNRSPVTTDYYARRGMLPRSCAYLELVPSMQEELDRQLLINYEGPRFLKNMGLFCQSNEAQEIPKELVCYMVLLAMKSSEFGK